MGYKPYPEVLKDHLEGSAFMRHLFEKLKNRIPCKVYCDSGVVYEGKIKSIDIVWRALEIVTNNGKTVYLNFRHIVAIEFDYVKSYNDLK